MKISQLPTSIKEKARAYQNDKSIGIGDPCDKDCIADSFYWNRTKEGASYWLAWHEAETQFDEVIHRYAISKADLYYLNTLEKIEKEGQWDVNPRPKWSDGTPAFSRFISQQSYDYRIDKGEFPIVSFRPTALRGAFHEIEAIYQLQTNIVEEMHPSIQPWWKPFVVDKYMKDQNGFKYSVDAYSTLKKNFPKQDLSKYTLVHSIGQTYGHTVARYDLVNKFLNSMEKDPFGRRHIMNLWQEQQRIEDPKALVPCAYETLYTISQDYADKRFVDMTLNQRSQDYIVTSSINPMEYVMLGQMICGDLTLRTGIRHELRNFKYNVQNVHIYDRHMFAIEEIMSIDSQKTEAFDMQLPEAKNFYQYNFEDFVFKNIPKTEPLSKKLEIAV